MVIVTAKDFHALTSLLDPGARMNVRGIGWSAMAGMFPGL
jgi:hypothetical protein